MKVILYTLSKSSNNVNSSTMKKWIHVKSVRSHTHDVRALTVAVPIIEEGLFKSLFLNFFVI
jgi:U3 small nucleolar RNA-associated protein 4